MSRYSTINRSGGLRSVQKLDAFPILDFKEISVCLQGCDFIANEDLVSHPLPQYIRSLFEQLLDTFIGFSPDYCLSAAAALYQRDQSSASQESTPKDDISDSVNILVFFQAANALLEVCGVNDLTLMDLTRPEPQRMRRILSAIINYARFREEHLRECEPLVKICEDSMEKLRKADDLNADLQTKIGNLQSRLDPDGEQILDSEGNKSSSLDQLNKYNARLENELKKLQRAQELLKLEHIQYKATKVQLFEKLEDYHYLIGETNRELEKLKMYASTDTLLMQRVIDDLRHNMEEYEQELLGLANISHNTEKTVNSIQSIEDELRTLITIVQEIINDSRKLQESKESLDRQEADLENKRKTSEDLQLQIQRGRKKQEKAEEKLIKIRRQAQEREESAKERLHALEAEFLRLVVERGAKEEKLNETKTKINAVEGQINAMRSSFDTEWQNTEAAVAKLNAHVRSYMAEVSSHYDVNF